MGDIVEVDFKEKESFRKEMDLIIDDFIECLRTHYGDDAGDLMASAFSVCLEEIAVRVTKQLELRQTEGKSDILFTPEDGEIGISFTSDFKLC
jgi:hypothetical protein